MTVSELLAQVTSQAQSSSFYTDQMKILSVKSYGAKGDGVADDATAIKNTLAALPTGGGVCYLPAGNYLIGSSIALTKGQRLIGASMHSTYIANATGGPSPLVKTTSGDGGGIEIAHLQFQGANSADIFVQLLGVDDCYIHHCRFYSPTSGNGTAIQCDANSVSGAYSHRIMDNDMSQVGVGVELKGGTNACVVAFNRIVAVDAAIETTGTTATGGNAYCFNLLEAQTSASGDGIDLSAVTTGDTILGNYIQQFASGVILRSGSAGNLIAMNHWDNNTANVTDQNAGKDGASLIDMGNGIFSMGRTDGTAFFSAGDSASTKVGFRALDTHSGGGEFSWLAGEPAVGDMGLRNDATGNVAAWCDSSDSMHFLKQAFIENTTAGVYAGTGTPESAVTAAVGSIYLRTDGGTSTTLYVKESGTGNTGWVAK